MISLKHLSHVGDYLLRMDGSKFIIYYNNKCIPTLTYTKFLSLTVDCSLTWVNHIDSLTKKKKTKHYMLLNLKY